MLTMAESSIHILAKNYKNEKAEYTSYKIIILFILMQTDDFVSISFIPTPSDQGPVVQS